jgi:hypothetical protein
MTMNAYQHWDVLAPPGSDRGMDGFLERWCAFLDELWARGLLRVRGEHEGIRGPIWNGTALNLGSHSVKWSDASASRIVAQLRLWWYVWISGRQKIRDFVKKLGGKRSNEKWPDGKKALESLGKGLSTVVRYGEEDLLPDELAKRQEERIVALLTLARVDMAEGDSAPDDGDEEDEEESIDEPDVDEAVIDEGADEDVGTEDDEGDDDA